jgi:hypothetical protein
MTYNGWPNRDTWLCVLWILNHESNYQRLVALTPDQIKQITKNDLLYWFYYGDKIDFSNVSIPSIVGMMLEMTGNEMIPPVG